MQGLEELVWKKMFFSSRLLFSLFALFYQDPKKGERWYDNEGKRKDEE